MTAVDIVLSVWMALFGHRAPTSAHALEMLLTANAIEFAVLNDDLPPVTGSIEGDAALAAVYAEAESGVWQHPKPLSWDARAGVSCGVWQMPCAFVRSHTLREQAIHWLQMMHAAVRACPAHPGAMLCGSCTAGAPRRMARTRWVRAAVLLAATRP